ncbi:MAG: thioredoxin family protein [Bdellovibrionales bacterium]
MALTYTPMGELGAPCPDFRLPSVDGKTVSRDDFAPTKALVIMFICNHCPYVQAIEDRLLLLAREYLMRGVRFVGICANDPTEYPEDAPAALLQRWKEKNYGFPYLIDADQETARRFGAVCTPDLYVYDSEFKLRYRGRLDDSWREPQKVQRQELKEALDALLGARAVNPVQNPSMGCSIKWKA